MPVDQAPAPSGGLSAESSLSANQTLNVSITPEQRQKQLVEDIPDGIFVHQAIGALRQFHRFLDLVTDEIRSAHQGGDPYGEPPEDHLPMLKAMAPTADAVMSRLLGEDVSPEGRVMLKSARKIINDAIAEFPKVPYFGADPSHEFQVGKDMLSVATRMIEMGFR